MPTKHTLPPLQRTALLAMLSDPTETLTRVPGGFFCPASKAHPVFTKRTVQALERDCLVAFDSPKLPTEVKFTNEGRAIATQLLEADHAKAGSA